MCAQLFHIPKVKQRPDFSHVENQRSVHSEHRYTSTAYPYPLPPPTPTAAREIALFHICTPHYGYDCFYSPYDIIRYRTKKNESQSRTVRAHVDNRVHKKQNEKEF